MNAGEKIALSGVIIAAMSLIAFIALSMYPSPPLTPPTYTPAPTLTPTQTSIIDTRDMGRETYKEGDSSINIKSIPGGTVTREDLSESTFSLTCTPPSSPMLTDLGTIGTDGNYTVSWTSVSSANTYTLEEDTSSLFSSPTMVYSRSGTSKEITGKSDGTYYYHVMACNECGCSEWSNIEYIKIKIDTILPTVTISYPTNGQAFRTPAITVNGTASDNVAVSKVEVKVGSGGWQTASGTTSWSKPVTLAPGSNTIYARAAGTSGNIIQTSVTVTYDITRPAIYHENISNATRGENISIFATITDDTTKVASAILFYRITGEEVWITTSMDHVGDIYSATIPASHVTTAGVQYYIEAVDDASNTAYNPATAPEAPYTITAKVNVGYAIIIAGRRDDDCGRIAIDLSAKNTYNILLKRGFTNESIFYLNPGMKQDVDGNGIFDVDKISSRTNIKYAINTWAQGNVSVNVPLLIYMVGHCKNDKFIVNGAEDELTASDLNNYLDHVNDSTGCQDITVVYEAGNSGCFIDDLSRTGRIILTSTGEDASSKFTKGMGGVFSYYFFNRISAGDTIKCAFEAASDSPEIIQYSENLVAVGFPPQTPLLEDNGDGVGHAIPLGTQDGSLAASKYIGTQEGGCS